MKQYEEKNAPKLNHDITLEEIEAACRAHQKENDNRNMAEECRAIAREQKEKMQLCRRCNGWQGTGKYGACNLLL